MTTNKQLELGFRATQSPGQGGRNPDHTTRAAWWFGQMRRVVANAVDWQAVDQSQNPDHWTGRSPAK